MIQNRLFGDSGKRVVIEEFFKGDELSILLFTDGDKIIPLASSQDHKRAYDDDQGPNTGGMGAYSPCPIVSDQELNDIIDKTARPVLQELKKREITYRGLLYVGIMMTDAGPQVLEFNVRFGDPEAEAVLLRLKTDIVPIMYEIANGKLKTQNLEWDPRACVAVVIASGGYPGTYQCGYEIKGLEFVKDAVVFHAGTMKDGAGRITNSGGRVLVVSALGKNFKEARDLAYQSVEQISFQDSFYRKDIGKRVLERTEVK